MIVRRFEVSIDAWIGEGCVYFYLDTSDDDLSPIIIPFQEMIDKIVEVHKVPGAQDIHKDGIDELLQIARGLKSAAKYAKKMAKEYSE